MIRQDEIVAIGKFQKTHALKGELNALLDVDAGYLADGNPVVIDIDGISVPFYACSVRPKGTQSYLVCLEGVDSEEEARGFVNKTIYGLKEVVKRYFAEIDEEAMLYDDLVGLRAIDTEAGEFGTVQDIDDSTDNPLFHVETPDGETVYVPLHGDMIEEINPEEGFIRFNLPQGLIDINRKQ